VRNNQGVKIFIILFVCTFFIFGFSHFGAKAFYSMINSDIIPDGTSIGAVDISGKTPNEAAKLVDDQLTKWLAETVIGISFKEKTVQLDNAFFQFEVVQSVEEAIDGKRNEVRVHIDKEPFADFLNMNFPTAVSEIDAEKLFAELLTAANHLEIGEYEVELEKAMPEDANQEAVLNEASVEASDRWSGNMAEQFIIEIPARSQFSLLSFLKENGLENESAEELSVLANAIYQVILPSNFSILERHISNEKPDYARLGFEARVNPEKKMDLAFANNNDLAFRIEWRFDAGILDVTLLGSPLLYQYSITTKDEQNFAPKTIKRIDPLLSPGEVRVQNDGKDGELIKVIRQVYDETGVFLTEEVLSEDYYPPVHRVEIHGVIDEENGSQPNGDEEFPPDEPNLPGEQDVTDSDETKESGITDRADDAEETTDDEENQYSDLWGKPNEVKK
jgi:hypothetical protein